MVSFTRIESHGSEDTGKLLTDNLPEQLKSFYRETIDLVNNERFDYLSQFQVFYFLRVELMAGYG
jgi:hypothetical protein